MALIDLTALLTELNTAAAVETTNLRGYFDILAFPSTSTQSKGIINVAKTEAENRHDVLTKAITAIQNLVGSGYPAVTYPVVPPADIATINAEIDAEVLGVRKVMKKLGSTV
jgi:hypothetical protein